MTGDEVAGYDSGGTIRMHFVVGVPGQYGSCSFFGPPTGPGGSDTGTFTWKFYSMSEDRIYDLRGDLSNWANYLGTRESYRVDMEELLPTPSPTQTLPATPSPSRTPSPTPRYSATPSPTPSSMPTVTPSPSATPSVTPTPTPSPSSPGLRMVIAGNDYDGDGRADPAAWNYRKGKWYIDLSSSGVRESYCNETVGGVFPSKAGQVTQIPVDRGIGLTPEILRGKSPPTEPNPVRSVAEVADLGSCPGHRPGLQSSAVIYFGNGGDIPASGDYDGDGVTEPAVYRPSTGLWAVRGLTRLYFGSSGDCSVPGDYNGNGTIDSAIFRPASGLWAVRGITRLYFGGTGDIPIPGDYNGNGITDPAIFRPSSNLWAIRGVTRGYFGAFGDSPVPADYDGDEIADIGIFREESGLWAIQDYSRLYFGGLNDYPQPADYSGTSTAQISIYRPATGLWAIRGSTRIYWGGLNYIPVSW